ncbi:cytidine deaminase [Selenomonas sp. WCT3]|uniref:cytidine deaminase n=1 Tax=Selenomonas sp. WCT3 TaxID=3158785 RepID=UPI00088DC806|nr:cytidine deaminase [Selenomonas ruminantium]
MLNEEIVDAMVRAAMKAMDNAYAPYSGHSVGACVLAADGTLYTGVNIENAIGRLSVAAAEVAMYRAVADGKREFDGVLVISDFERPFVPNGAVLQLLAEFEVPEVVMANMEGKIEQAELKTLLPYAREPIENAAHRD